MAGSKATNRKFTEEDCRRGADARVASQPPEVRKYIAKKAAAAKWKRYRERQKFLKEHGVV